MRMTVTLGLIALSLITGMPSSASAISYTFLPFPDDPVAAPGTTHARGINNAGQIVGWAIIGGSPEGFLRSPDGTFQTIGGGEVGTRVNGINNSGVMVGADLLNPVGDPVARTFNPTGSAGVPPGFATKSEAFGINDNFPNNNSIVGSLTTASSGKVEAFQTPSGAVTIFPGVGSPISVQLFGISNNDNGRRFVGTQESSSGVFQGFFQTGSDIASSQLVTIPGASRTDAFGTQYNSPFNIPAVVGEYTLGGVTHGYVLPAGNGNILAGLQTIDATAPGATATRLFGINDLGQIVGEFDSHSTHGFALTPFADSQAGTINSCLHNPLLCESQIDGGHIGAGANAIDCNAFAALCGSVDQILALLLLPNAPPPESFILVSTSGVVGIPEPSTLLLLVSGLGGLAGIAWRRRGRL